MIVAGTGLRLMDKNRKVPYESVRNSNEPVWSFFGKYVAAECLLMMRHTRDGMRGACYFLPIRSFDGAFSEWAPFPVITISPRRFS